MLYAPALIVLVIVASAGTIMVDGDTYLHVAAGDWIVRHGQFLHSDPFTYTFGGAHWNAPEWLSELLMALAFRIGAWQGVALLFAIASGLSALLLARHLLKFVPPLPAVILLQFAMACVAVNLSSRPYLLALPVLAGWTSALLSARLHDRAPHWSLLAVMTLWSNLHGSFVFGLGLVGVFAAEAFFTTDDRWRAATRWGLFGLASIVAAIINPNGVNGLIAPFVFATRPILAHVVDWQSMVFPQIGPFELTLLALLALGLYRPARLPIFRLLLLLLLVHMALAHRRHIYLFALITPMLLAEAMSAETIGSATASNRPSPIADAIALLVAMVIASVRLAIPDIRGNDKSSPSAALAHVPADLLSQPVLNEDLLGGFLIWHGIRPFIDTRVELYDDGFLANYIDIITPHPGALEATLAHYKIIWTFLLPRNPANVVLATLPGWRRIYADQYAVIYARSPGAEQTR